MRSTLQICAVFGDQGMRCKEHTYIRLLGDEWNYGKRKENVCFLHVFPQYNFYFI